MVEERIPKCDVIRVMPNLSVAVGEGTSGMMSVFAIVFDLVMLCCFTIM